jgi:uncharacterized phage protein gp47/JayE
MSEVTDSGLDIDSIADILGRIQTFQRVKISSKLSFSKDTPLGAINPIIAEEIEAVLELCEEAYNAYDRDNATDDRLVALAELLGVSRRGASAGVVAATVNVNAGLTFAAGSLVAFVDGEPTNLWENRDALTSGAAGNYSVVFVSQGAGAAFVAPAGTLTEIDTPVAGWNTVTNAADALAGLDIEPVSALRLRMAQATARGGQRTTAAIRSAIVALPGVLSCDVFENVTNAVDANGVEPHAIRAVIWDGSPGLAVDNDIAQAIWDRSGTFSQGSVSATATDETLGDVEVNFDRATASAVTVAVNIESAAGVAKADVIAAIQAAMPVRVGQEVTYHKLTSAVFRVPGVDDWVSFTVNGGIADLPAVQTTIYLLDSSGVTVSGDAT